MSGISGAAKGAEVHGIEVPNLDLLRCPLTGDPLHLEGACLVGTVAGHTYAIGPQGIPLFADQFCSREARAQQAHYDKIAATYAANLGYPHTQEYMAYLDRVLLDVVVPTKLGTVAEICCGRGEAFQLLRGRIGRGIGVDVSLPMLRAALNENPSSRLSFVQGDATMLPLVSNAFDSVFILGGIHHVTDRHALFKEIARILKPGGHLYFREPVSDFIVWRSIREVIYRVSPTLDHKTERPLLHRETVPVLEAVQLQCRHWRTHGFLGFCFFMNSDVLIFNRLFRFMPGIRALTRASTRLDEWTTSLPGLQRAGLQVVAVAEKPVRIDA